ncbi:hypothetical protein E2C01_085314 [Portunus trituberculatus]|uniref:Uncharacterized protein n=1 Tax=Portunus trituberculatus TaxID=210409 RepID=A0A5B7JD91_PORTR|nr:hypothetical protein [Portunus trituberculatus]
MKKIKEHKGGTSISIFVGPSKIVMIYKFPPSCHHFTTFLTTTFTTIFTISFTPSFTTSFTNSFIPSFTATFRSVPRDRDLREAVTLHTGGRGKGAAPLHIFRGHGDCRVFG